MLEPPSSYRPATASSGATTQEEEEAELLEEEDQSHFKHLEDPSCDYSDLQRGHTTVESTLLEEDDSALDLVSRSYTSVASLLNEDGKDIQDISSSRIDDEDEDDSMIDQEEREALASMRRVEERLDALDAEAEYKGASVYHLREQLQQSLREAPKLFRADSWHRESYAQQQQQEQKRQWQQQGQPLDAEEEAVVRKDPALRSVFDHLGMLTPNEARSLLRRCCIRVAEMKEASRRHEVECKMQTAVISECRAELSKARDRLSLATGDYEQKLREREVQLKHLRRAQTATATELKNLKNYLRTRGDNLVRLSRSVDKASVRGSKESSLISAVQRAEPVMLRVSRKSLRAIPKEKLEARIREKTSASQELVSVMRDSLQDEDGENISRLAERKVGVEHDQDVEKSASFGANTTKLIAQTGFVML